MTRVVLDISRLISRVRHARPSGVDRVEMAYARGLMDRYGRELEFAAVHPTRAYGRIDRQTATAYLDELERRWANKGGPVRERSIVSVAPWMRRLLPRRTAVGSGDVLVQVSPHHLDRIDEKRSILEREQAKFVCMVHDLIPIEYPEYARPGGDEKHASRMRCVAQLADAVIVNSANTGASFKRWVASTGAVCPPVHVALLGTQQLPEPSQSPALGDTPYFVCLGTIEPRKNHLLLLHQWRHMVETLPAQRVPHLKVIGRRGWENEQVVDMLDRSHSLQPFVEEINACSDEELAALLKGASGLLMPSFAEGYGMPIAEALASGTPVLASDIPAHHEAGGSTPDYIDPRDGPRWQEAILDYSENGAQRREQIKRLAQYKAPDWNSHLDIAQTVIEGSLR